jgi:acyl-CoA thioester hydrolase
MNDVAPKPALDQRTTFDSWTEEKIRFCDTDKLGHVNNGVFAVLSETGRIAHLHDPTLPPVGEGRSWVIVRLELDYRAELLWPAKVDIGTVLLHVGRSSVRIGQGMFWGDVCVSTAENVMALMDLTTRRSTPIPDPLRDELTLRMAARL